MMKCGSRLETELGFFGSWIWQFLWGSHKKKERDSNLERFSNKTKSDVIRQLMMMNVLLISQRVLVSLSSFLKVFHLVFSAQNEEEEVGEQRSRLVSWMRMEKSEFKVQSSRDFLSFSATFGPQNKQTWLSCRGREVVYHHCSLVVVRVEKLAVENADETNLGNEMTFFSTHLISRSLLFLSSSSFFLQSHFILIVTPLGVVRIKMTMPTNTGSLLRQTSQSSIFSLKRAFNIASYSPGFVLPGKDRVLSQEEQSYIRRRRDEKENWWRLTRLTGDSLSGVKSLWLWTRRLQCLSHVITSVKEVKDVQNTRKLCLSVTFFLYYAYHFSLIYFLLTNEIHERRFFTHFLVSRQQNTFS